MEFKAKSFKYNTTRSWGGTVQSNCQQFINSIDSFAVWFALSIARFWGYRKVMITAVRIITICPRPKFAMYVSNRNGMIRSFYQDFRNISFANQADYNYRFLQIYKLWKIPKKTVILFIEALADIPMFLYSDASIQSFFLNHKGCYANHQRSGALMPSVLIGPTMQRHYTVPIYWL